VTGRRALRAVALAIALALFAPAGAGAQVEAGTISAARDTSAPTGTTVMFASAAYPGLGQLLNDAEPKAAVVSAVEAFLIARLIVEDRRTRNLLRLYEQTNDERYYDEYSVHFDRRQALIWWAVVAALYGLADAYVDAHLASFEDSHAPRLESSIGGETGDEVRIGLAFRF
jgi:hypothetical protein